MSYRYTPSRPPIITDPLDSPVYASTPHGTRTSNNERQQGNSRKQSETINLNHLLNFTMPARNGHGSGHGGSGGGTPRRSRGVKFQNGAYLREKYVNSQFRFIMKPTGNYNAHLADPDIFFNWPSILQVIVPTVSALSQAQGDEPATLPCVNDSGIYGGGDQERRLRKEQEREGSTCPICLGRPVAGRMTKCGHIFCYPCILHYFQLSDIPKCAKCPICGDTIQERMLKAIRWWDSDFVTEAIDDDTPHPHPPSRATPFHETLGIHLDHHDHGSDIVGALELDSASHGSTHKLRMRLMQRPHISTLALPRSLTWPSEAVPLQSQAPFHFLPDVMAFSKFCLATPEYMVEQLDRDLAELAREKDMMVSSGDELGATFVEAAERKVREQMSKAKDELNVPPVRRMEKQAREAMVEIHRTKEEVAVKMARMESLAVAREEEKVTNDSGLACPSMKIPAMHLAMTGQPAYVNEVSPTPSPQPTTPKSRGNRRQQPPVALASQDEPAYLFYQAATGTNIFLHPLDIKILLSYYKAYASFPNTITIRPEGSDEGTINEELRKRCKYLSHLPLGTDVVFVEADLEDTLGQAAVAPFEQALKQRRNRRREKVRKEDRAKSRWEAKEREKLPFSARGDYSAFTGEADSEDFLLALERSTLEAVNRAGYPAMDGSNPSSATTSYLSTNSASFPPSALVAESRSGGLSPNVVDAAGNTIITSGVSPPGGYRLDGVWGSSASGRGFSSGQHGDGLVRPKKKTEEDLEMDQVWSAFQESATSASSATNPEGQKGGGKKKNKKVVLNMSSGGRGG